MTKNSSISNPSQYGPHQWQRFWTTRTSFVDLSDGGFMADPTTTSLYRPRSEAPVPLSELSNHRALVLLGEPGMGKSVALAGEASRVTQRPPDENVVSVHVDLRAFSGEDLLYRKVFESKEMGEWKAGKSELVLHLDSLDEALLRIETIANLIAGELPHLPTDRLSLRIACRTAVWAQTALEEMLVRTWGQEGVGVFELTPLRRCDVVLAARDRNVDPDAFITELYSANVVSFAIKPLTLNLLLTLYQRDGCLPRSIAELYTLGCKKLCEEQNPSRRDTKRLGTLNASQRLRLAGRIAATTMLANRFAIWTGPETDLFPKEDVPLSKLAVGSEAGDFQTFDATEDGVREVLDTGLFSARGANRMGWAHQGYAEFLAALYLIEKEVSPRNILKLILHPAGGLVPQLATVAGWLASLSEDVRRHLIESEPLTLLHGDLANWSAADLAALTAALLEAIEQKRAHDFVPGIALAYSRLCYSGMAADLQPFVTDKTKDVPVRRAAIMMAEACKLGELQSEFLNVALDTTEDPALRARAISALGKCGDSTIPARLLPFAQGRGGPDPFDDIKGNALRILWPAHISSTTLFSMIPAPNAGFVGSYVMFLTRELPKSMAKKDLLPALAWATTFVTNLNHMGDFHRKSLSDSIFLFGWEHFEDPAIAQQFVAHVAARLHHAGDLFKGTDHEIRDEFAKNLSSNPTRRQQFILAATGHSFAKIDAFYLHRAGLLKRSDFEWLLGLRPVVGTPTEQVDEQTLCNMLDSTFDRDNQAHFDALYDAATGWPELRQTFEWLLDPVPLDSPRAEQAREHLRLAEQLRQDPRPPLDPPPRERVRALLDRFEAADLEAWWQLNLDLTLEANSTHYGLDHDYFITSMPGWRDSDEDTRQRILSAAERFLSDGEPRVRNWLGTNQFDRYDYAGYRALLLLREREKGVYDLLPNGVWQKWAPVVLAVQTEIGTEEGERHQEVMAEAVSAAPEQFCQTVKALIDGARAEAKQRKSTVLHLESIPFLFLQRIEKCWVNQSLKNLVFKEMKLSKNSPAQFGALLEPLLEADFEPARSYAIQVLTDRRPRRRRYVLAAAELLASHCPQHSWSNIWAIVVADERFGKDLLLRLGNHRGFEQSPFSGLSEAQLGDLYIWIEQKFPRASDPVHQGGEVHGVGPRERVAHMRDNLLRHLVSLGTVEAVQAVRTAAGMLPDLTWLPLQVRDAENVMRMKTWQPLTAEEVRRITASKRGVMIQSATDLLGVLIEALQKFEFELHGSQTPVMGLWDRQADGTFRPVDEDRLSDQVKLFLERELVNQGIVVNREVEVGRVVGAPVGKRTDVKIDAVRKAEDGRGYDTITAVIETKGCWNVGLFTAMDTQLHKDYLVRLGAPVGIYLVGWYDKPKWDDTDYRKKAVKEELEVTRSRLDAQAGAVPAPFHVRAVILDCHAH
jgi:hypothetical protein